MRYSISQGTDSNFPRTLVGGLLWITSVLLLAVPIIARLQSDTLRPSAVLSSQSSNSDQAASQPTKDTDTTTQPADGQPGGSNGVQPAAVQPSSSSGGSPVPAEAPGEPSDNRQSSGSTAASGAFSGESAGK